MAPSTSKPIKSNAGFSAKVTAGGPAAHPSSKGKGKATMTSSSSSVGAPAQYGQTQRKGKKAWRKNIDIQPEEKALEVAREDERITGGAAKGAGPSGGSFFIDTIGDPEVARRLRKPAKPLRSLAILSARSAVPSLTSRASKSDTPAPVKKVSAKDKARLLRIARKGGVPATDGLGLGSAVIDSLGKKGEDLRDVWTEAQLADMEAVGSDGRWGFEAKHNSAVLKPLKPPVTIQRQREARILQGHERALPIPEEGTSYNPRLESYQALLDKALEEERARLQAEQEEQDKILRAGKVQVIGLQHYERGLAPGMTVAEGDAEAMREEAEADARAQAEAEVKAEAMKVEEGEEGEEVDAPDLVRKENKRKTQTEKNKAKRVAEAKRLLKQQQSAKALKKSLASLPTLTKSVESTLTARQLAVVARRMARMEKEAKGLNGGEKVGKHRVAKGAIAVQLGEDLSENLRELKPEGNLFRDRFLSLQQRALLEPRVRQSRTKRNLRLKEYEKHAWKRFE